MPWLVSWCAVTYSQSTYRWAKQKNVCATWLIHKCDVTQLYVTHSQSTYCWARPTLWLCEQFVCVTWLFFTRSMTHSHCDTTHSYVNHDSFACVPWLTCRLRIVGRDQYLVCATLLIHTCDVTHLYVCRDSLAGYTSLSETNNSCVWQDSFVRVPWLIRTCAVACSQATHRWARPTTHVPILYSSNPTASTSPPTLFTSRTRNSTSSANRALTTTQVCVPWLMRMCAMMHAYVCHICVPWRICMCAMIHLPTCLYFLPHELGTTPRAQIVCWWQDRYVCRDACVCVPWLICTFAMTHLYVCHDSSASPPTLLIARTQSTTSYIDIYTHGYR